MRYATRKYKLAGQVTRVTLLVDIDSVVFMSQDALVISIDLAGGESIGFVDVQQKI